MQIYNTLTRKTKKFIPKKKGVVKIYSCGVTPYDEIHLGHARQAIVFDVLRNYLTYLGNKVDYVRNFTDVDDKIIKRSAERGITSLELSEHFILESQKDLKKLKVSPATYEPKVTDHIQEIVNFIQELIDKGYAYESNGEVLFSVNKFNEYGKLSNQKIDELVSSEESNNKKDSHDFALWKPQKEGEPAWGSPWGLGRPGWHIECSVLSRKYLGDTIDIHGGGLDLIFPHHENEIAQSEACSNQPLANYWVHNGLVMVDGEKMSKSLGNFYTVKDLLAKYTPEEIRFFILSSKYSSKVDFSYESLLAIRKRVYYFYKTLYKLENYPYKKLDEVKNDLVPKEILEIVNSFKKAMDDDFNTPQVMANLSSVFKIINMVLESSEYDDERKSSIFSVFKNQLNEISAVLQILDEPPQQYINSLFKLVVGDSILIKEVEVKVKQVAKFRKKKEYGKVDEIRQELLVKGISLQDKKDGSTDWDLSFS